MTSYYSLKKKAKEPIFRGSLKTPVETKVDKEPMEVVNLSDRNRFVYTAPEAAEILRIDARTLRSMLEKGQLYGFRCGSAWRIPEESLKKLLDYNDGDNPRRVSSRGV